MNEVIENRAVSPCVGRSESPSQRHVATAAERQSRAAQPASGASAPFTAAEPWQSGAETVTESDQSGGGPCVVREDEPERAPSAQRRRRNVLVQLPTSTADHVDQLAEQSGLPRAHFLTTALLIGATKLAGEVRPQ